jgi:hypothetical protein
MTATLPDIPLTSQWQDVHDISGAAPGSEIGLQNKSPLETAIIQLAPAKPLDSSTHGFPVPPFPSPNSFVQIEADPVNKTWVRLLNGDGFASVVL